VALDLLSGMGTNGGRRPYFPQDGPTEVVSHLNSNQVTADLNAVADFARKQTAICLCRPSVGLEELLFRDEPRGSATALFYGPPRSDLCETSSATPSAASG